MIFRRFFFFLVVFAFLSLEGGRAHGHGYEHDGAPPVCQLWLSAQAGAALNLGLESLLEHIAGDDIKSWERLWVLLQPGFDEDVLGGGVETAVWLRVLRAHTADLTSQEFARHFVEKRIERLRLEARSRELVEVKTREVGLRLVFPRIILHGKGHLDLAENLVTERLWLKVMGRAPRNSANIFSGGLLPVRKIRIEELREFFDRLNEGRFESASLSEVIQGHQSGDRYRLMTFKEQKNFARKILRAEAQNQDVLNRKTFSEYVYSFEDSNGLDPCPVGTKAPIFVQGHPFFDLLGNVEEMVASSYAIDSESTRYGTWGGSASTEITDFLIDPRRSRIWNVHGTGSTWFPSHEGLSGFRVVRVRSEGD